MPIEIQQIGRRKLRMINNSQNRTDLRIPPSNRLEKLQDTGFCSIRINDQWRIERQTPDLSFAGESCLILIDKKTFCMDAGCFPMMKKPHAGLQGTFECCENIMQACMGLSNIAKSSCKFAGDFRTC